jgi:hypothetical protein
VSIAVVGGASLEPPWFVPFETTVTFFFPQDAEAEGASLATFFAFVGAAYVCPLDFAGEVAGVRLCGGIQGGLLNAAAEGFDRDNNDELRGLLGAALRARGHLRFYGPLHGGAAATLNVPFFRDTFTYESASGETVELFTPAPVSGTFELFGMVRFP